MLHHFVRLYRNMFVGAIGVFLLLQPGMVFAASPPSQRPMGPLTDQSKVIVKFKGDAGVDLSGTKFVRSAQDGHILESTDQLNSILQQYGVTSQRRLIADSKKHIQESRNLAQDQLQAGEGDLENYYELSLGHGKKADKVAAELKKQSSVVTAYAKPLPMPLPTTTNLVPLQKHLQAAPVGMSVNPFINNNSILHRTYPGALGDNVAVTDIEYSWNDQHEDLSALRKPNALWPNYTPVDPFDDHNHGTAVTGIIAGDRNGFGIDGMVPNASFHMVNANTKEYGYFLSNAIYMAANKMAAGDVMLLEQQATAPDGQGYAPIEIYADIYDAIRYTTAKGIIVIEPAGNGHANDWEGYDLGAPQFGGAFTTKPSSGAIMVGAGGSGCDGSAPRRARALFSNYGSRIDIQGVGDCVVTAGYGDIYYYGPNAKYTSYFGGTSSASATIAGAAASISSTYTTLNRRSITPIALKAALQYGAQPQDTTVNFGNIGSLPNMAYALKKTDVSQPSAASRLVGKRIARNRISLSWQPARDNLPYIRYDIYRNGLRIRGVTTTHYIDRAISRPGRYIYKVYAVDASGNTSLASNSISVIN